MPLEKLHYKGCTAHFEYDDDDKIFFGRLIAIRDIVGFHADTLDELEKEFQISVDDYLAYAAERDSR